MYSFRELQKACRLEIAGPEEKVAVLGNCATQFFAAAIEGLGKLNGLNLSVYDADYNQIDGELLDPASGVYAFQPDEIVLWLCTEKLYEDFLDLPFPERNRFADSILEKPRPGNRRALGCG